MTKCLVLNRNYRRFEEHDAIWTIKGKYEEDAGNKLGQLICCEQGKVCVRFENITLSPKYLKV